MKPIFAIPATLALVYRAYSRKSLTPTGILTAALTATIHALHPYSAPFVLLCVFFLAGTAVTKVKHDVKSRLTISAASGNGGAGGEGPRTYVQVLANSGVASALVVGYVWLLWTRGEGREGECFAGTGVGARIEDVLVVGIVA
jgi:uncharacterized membrane protein